MPPGNPLIKPAAPPKPRAQYGIGKPALSAKPDRFGSFLAGMANATKARVQVGQRQAAAQVSQQKLKAPRGY